LVVYSYLLQVGRSRVGTPVGVRDFIFSITGQKVLGSTQWVPGLFPCDNRRQRGVDYLLPSGAEFKNGYSYSSTTLCAFKVCYRAKLTFFLHGQFFLEDKKNPILHFLSLLSSTEPVIIYKHDNNVNNLKSCGICA
jgi:hypothetical protein